MRGILPPVSLRPNANAQAGMVSGGKVNVAHLLNRIVYHAILFGAGREANRPVPSPLEPTVINSPRIKRQP